MKEFEKIIQKEDSEIIRGMLLELCYMDKNNQNRLINIYYRNSM